MFYPMLGSLDHLRDVSDPSPAPQSAFVRVALENHLPCKEISAGGPGWSKVSRTGSGGLAHGADGAAALQPGPGGVGLGRSHSNPAILPAAGGGASVAAAGSRAILQRAASSKSRVSTSPVRAAAAGPPAGIGAAQGLGPLPMRLR
jgi:hypothetical protein